MGEMAVIGEAVNATQNNDGSWTLFVGNQGIVTLQTNNLDVNGTADFGDQVTLSDTVWDDLRVPLSGLVLGANSDPALAQIQDNNDSSTGVYGFKFDAGTEEELFFALQLPHGYKAGTDLSPHVHWSPISATTKAAVWGLEYTMCPIGGAFGYTAIVTVADDANGTALEHNLASFADITATSMAESAMLIGRVFRDAANDADTISEDVVLHEIDFHYQIDKIGSDNETP